MRERRARAAFVVVGAISCAVGAAAAGEGRADRWGRGSSAALVFPSARVLERERALEIEGLAGWERWRNDERVSVREWDPRPSWWAWPDWPRPAERRRIPPIHSEWGRRY